MDELFYVSNFRTRKKIWDTLEVTHEGTMIFLNNHVFQKNNQITNISNNLPK